MRHLESPMICPKCLSDSHVRAKALLIGKASPKLLFSDYEERAGYLRRDQLAVDECKQEELQSSPLEQFVNGYYCDQCGIGFVPDDITSSAVQLPRSGKTGNGA